jgi:phenylalanyl-tRNA synthetase beta chain
MLELGQPLHAFDLDKLAGGRIVVRRSRAGETIIPITAKDDAPPTALQPDMLVIADAERPVAIAGVMGGKETEVSGDTVNLLLESAYFDPTSVRRTAKRTDLRTDSSYRFERGVDPNGVRRASDRAVQLILELAGGTASETVIDVYPSPIEPKRIPFRPERCRGLLGVEIPDAETRGYLDRLGFGVEESAGLWHVTAPTYRPDLAIEEDIIEEVGRLYGYDRLPETLPGGVSGAGKHSPLEELIRSVRELLSGQGLYEVVTNTLLARTCLQATRLESSPVWPGPDGRAVSLRNPLSEEFDTLRPSLLPGLLTAAQHNLRHGTRDIYLYESGYGTTETGDGQPTHRLLTAGLLLGSRWSEVWNPDRQGAVDFFGAKGTVEALVRGLGVPSLAGERAEHPAFHPGRAAWLSAGAERIGIVGELHPELAASLDLPRGVFLFELDAERLLVLSRSGERRYEAPSRYPRALRDLAITVDQTVPSGGIEQVIRETVGEFARSVRLFDVYAGKPLPEGKVSLAYALELGADDRTLTDEEVEGRLTAARERLQSEYGAEFRG